MAGPAWKQKFPPLNVGLTFTKQGYGPKQENKDVYEKLDGHFRYFLHDLYSVVRNVILSLILRVGEVSHIS